MCNPKRAFLSIFAAIDPDGLLCQSRDMQKWHGTRSNKSISGQGMFDYIRAVEMFSCGW